MASAGTIIANVSTSSAQIPVEGATVLFRQKDAPYSLLGFRVTDASGKTEPLVIATVDKALSQTPDPSQQPWTGIIVQAEHPEFERVVLSGVQIFPGITTVQSISLLPLQEHDPDMDQEQDFTFTPQPISEVTP